MSVSRSQDIPEGSEGGFRDCELPLVADGSCAGLLMTRLMRYLRQSMNVGNVLLVKTLEMLLLS